MLLGELAQRTPAALVGLVVAVVDVAAFAELITLRQSAAWLFAPTWPWLAMALLNRALRFASVMVSGCSTWSCVLDPVAIWAAETAPAVN